MFIHTVMSSEVITAEPTMSVGKAKQLLNQHRIRHLPIVSQNTALVGIISDRDLRSFLPSTSDKNENALKEALATPIEHIMLRNVSVCHPNDFVEDVALTFMREKINCMPVMQNGVLTGIVTTSDLLRTFVSLTCSNVPSTRLDLCGPNTSAAMLALMETITSCGVDVVSLLNVPHESNHTWHRFVVRVRTMQTSELIAKLEAKGFHVECPF
ncbi:MAG: CBS and ACT domain-containing protein [Bacilli bacterium]